MKTSDKNDKVKIKVQKVASKSKKLKFPIGFIETDQLSKLAKEIIEAQRVFAELIKPIQEGWKKVSLLMSKHIVFQDELWRSWFELYRWVSESGIDFKKVIENRIKISIQDAAKVLKKYKWVITPSLPAVFVFDVVEIGKRRGNQLKVLNKLFVEHFSLNNFKELKLLIDGWRNNRIFDPRKKIFRDCVFALENRKRTFNPSNIVLPTLIAQIDGILVEFMKEKGHSYDIKRRKWIDKTGKFVDKKRWFQKQTSVLQKDAMIDLSNEIFLNFLLQKAFPTHPLKSPFSFNRHKILHGENLKYGTIDNTIRAFLILDFLYMVTSEIC